MIRIFKQNNLGQSIIELLVVIGLAAVILPTVFMGIMSSREGRAQQRSRMQALSLLREAQDATRSFRDNDWKTFAVDGTYHPTLSNNAWVLSPNAETVNGFLRQVVIADAYRDANGNASISGTLDNSTKLVTITVSWTNTFPSSIQSQMYLTRHTNLAYSQTTLVDFNAGVLFQSQTTITNNDDGDVILGNNNKAKWCSPAFSSATIDLPDGPPVAVAATASAVTNSIPNDVFVATAPYATSSVKLAYLNVSADADPPIATLEGTFTLDSSKYSNGSYVPTGIGLDNSFKTNDVKYYKSSGGKLYGLLATDNPSKEVIAVQINDGSGSTYQDPVNKIYKYWTYFNTKIYAPPPPTLVNATFETNNISPYTTVVNSGSGSTVSSPVHSGTYAAKVTTTKNSVSGVGGGGGCAGGKRVAVNSNTTYTWSGYVNAPTSGNTKFKDARIRVVYYSACSGGSTISTNDSNTITATGSTWTQVTGTANSGTATYAEIQLLLESSQSGTTSTAYYDDIDMSVATNFNDQAPFGYGASAITILGNTGYVDSGGYLYAFDLSNIDAKSPTTELNQVGCRILLDGYDCQVGTQYDLKYASGETGTTWSSTYGQADTQNYSCSDGGNIELNADHQLSGVQVGNNKYIYVADGAGTVPELDIVDVTTAPGNLSQTSCGRGSDTGWKVTGTLDFDPAGSTQEAANSVYAKNDGTRAYMSSNGGIKTAQGIPDSDQFYIIDTSSKTAPKFLQTWPSNVNNQHYANTAETGFYNGDATNIELYPRRALTVLNGARAVLIGQDGIPNDGTEPKEYQVLNLDNEQTPLFCNGLNYLPGFNDMTSVTEANNDSYVYLVANTMEKQLKIIQGGPDTGRYINAGQITSKYFDAGKATAFNSFYANITKVLGTTDIQFQVAVGGDDNANCNTLSYQYVGPDGTVNTKFATSSAAIPLSGPTGYQNPGRCFSYKAFLTTTDNNQTPILNDFTANYSP